MGKEKLISFDLRADAGFLKKPDYNEGMLLSYNMLHKPALLGILGAITGLEGYRKKGELPQYYQAFKDLPVGIAPLAGYHEKGNFNKSAVKYSNTVGYANKDGNLLVEETMLLNPAYRCFILITLDNPEQAMLYNYLKTGQAEFIPYLGKNEYQAWWLNKDGESSFTEYEFEVGASEVEALPMLTLFRKEFKVEEMVDEDSADLDYDPIEFTLKPDSFAYFERLPAGFHPALFQYELEAYTFTNFLLKPSVALKGLYYLPELKGYVQLA